MTPETRKDNVNDAIEKEIKYEGCLTYRHMVGNGVKQSSSNFSSMGPNDSSKVDLIMCRL
jgi:hypothetical protein